MTEQIIDVEAVLSGLKDFQRLTAEYVFRRMFLDDDPAYRFLVADEVGLGKTHVAKGVIAQVIDHLQRIGDRRHDILYICSNSAIARQNLRKLLPPGIDAGMSADRLSMLPLESHRIGTSQLNLLPITPGTSLSFGYRGGKFQERALAYSLLRRVWEPDLFRRGRARWIFWEGLSADWGDDTLRDRSQDYDRRLNAEVTELFGDELPRIDERRHAQGRPRLRESFDDLVQGLKYRRKDRFPQHLKDERLSFISDLREALARIGVAMLEPDLIVLDEFQRFKNLLDPDPKSWAAQLATRLFTHQDSETGRPTRTLLLSATPYRMYTMTGDGEEEDHYADFVRTCSFLFNRPEQVADLNRRLQRLRSVMTMRNGLADAESACRAVEDQLRLVMARTERLSATPDRNGMLCERARTVEIRTNDLRGYARLGDLAELVRHPELVEYWKSSPFLINFMERYQLKHSVADAIAEGRPGLEQLLDEGPGLVNWAAIDRYEEIDPENGRLRALIDDIDTHRAWELLWLPPAQPYYSTGSVYESDDARAFTKRLIFSGWTVVPKVVSTLVSYEAERRWFAEQRPKVRYSTEYSRRRARLLDWRMDRHRPGSMTTFLLMWPSPTLAQLGDPRRIPLDRVRGPVSSETVLLQVEQAVAEALTPHLAGTPTDGPIDQQWYWAAPLLLDAERHPGVFDEWFSFHDAAHDWTSSEQVTGFAAHLERAYQLYLGEIELGRPPDDLARVLATVAVGGPAVCALRALAGVVDVAPHDPIALRAAARVAWGFRSLFNSPEATAVVAPVVGDMPYWRSVLEHAVMGNLQALLDEHLHVVRDWLGYLVIDDADAAAGDIANCIYEALSVRTTTYRVDIPGIGDRGEMRVDEHRMRGRFAVPFGNQRTEDGGEARVESLSRAFNSPFWPFVLTSTSIGQEGLDFHLWCHAVIHWNLPYNPVDLEQREGRVHRYKGHAVRKNLAHAMGSIAFADERDPWAAIFRVASEQRTPGDSEMVPYWVFEGDAKIERYVPTLPFSREEARLPQLRKSLATYRLAFGQPRQEELIELLAGRMDQEELEDLSRRLYVDLSPKRDAYSPQELSSTGERTSARRGRPADP